MVLCFVMTSPSSVIARSTLLQYNGFVLGLWEFNRLKRAGDEKAYESISQRLEKSLTRLKRDFHGINSVKAFYRDYEFNFEWAEGILESIMNNETYSTLEMKNLIDSIPLKEFLSFTLQGIGSRPQYFSA